MDRHEFIKAAGLGAAAVACPVAAQTLPGGAMRLT